MTFVYRSHLMAQALSIVGEAGIHGMDHNGLITRIWPDSESMQSKRMRWSPISAHKFTQDEFEEYMILAWRFGFVTRSGYKEWEHAASKDKSSYASSGDEVVRLTREGWEFIEKNDRPLMHRWFANIAENVPTIVISVLTALAVSWTVYNWGAPK